MHAPEFIGRRRRAQAALLASLAAAHENRALTLSSDPEIPVALRHARVGLGFVEIGISPQFELHLRPQQVGRFAEQVFTQRPTQF
jgi:hypothetical protein